MTQITTLKEKLLAHISSEEDQLNEQDAESHIWWNKFRELVESLDKEEAALFYRSSHQKTVPNA